MSLELFFIILFALMIMQVIGTHFQIKAYRRAIHRLHKKGHIGIGGKRSRFGPGQIVIIACDGRGAITGGEMMSGMTVFSRFQEIPDISGKSIYEMERRYSAAGRRACHLYAGHLQAVQALVSRLETGGQ